MNDSTQSTNHQGHSHTHSASCNHSGPSQQSNPKPAASESFLTMLLFHIEGILKFAFIPSVFILPGYANILAASICVLGVIRQCKTPRFSKEWGRKFLTNEFTQNLFYMVPFLFFPGSKNLVYYLPLGIHFWIGLSQYIYMKQPAVYKLLKKYVDFTRQNDRILKIQKAKLEVYQLGFIIFFSLLGQGSLLLLLLYGNFLRIKYALNSFTQLAFAEMNYWIEGKINGPSCPGFVRTIVQKIRAVCAYLVKM